VPETTLQMLKPGHEIVVVPSRPATGPVDSQARQFSPAMF
jgi:hypothetical protein